MIQSSDPCEQAEIHKSWVDFAKRNDPREPIKIPTKKNSWVADLCQNKLTKTITQNSQWKGTSF